MGPLKAGNLSRKDIFTVLRIRVFFGGFFSSGAFKIIKIQHREKPLTYFLKFLFCLALVRTVQMLPWIRAPRNNNDRRVRNVCFEYNYADDLCVRQTPSTYTHKHSRTHDGGGGGGGGTHKQTRLRAHDTIPGGDVGLHTQSLCDILSMNQAAAWLHLSERGDGAALPSRPVLGGDGAFTSRWMGRYRRDRVRRMGFYMKGWEYRSLTRFALFLL